MPSLGLGIHEFDHAKRRKTPRRATVPDLRALSLLQLMDARAKPWAKPWHDEKMCPCEIAGGAERADGSARLAVALLVFLAGAARAGGIARRSRPGRGIALVEGRCRPPHHGAGHRAAVE